MWMALKAIMELAVVCGRPYAHVDGTSPLNCTVIYSMSDPRACGWHDKTYSEGYSRKVGPTRMWGYFREPFWFFFQYGPLNLAGNSTKSGMQKKLTCLLYQ